MSTPGVLVGTYQPGTSVLHRLPAGLKLLVGAVASLLVVVVRSLEASAIFLAVAMVLAAIARLRPSLLWRATRVVLLLAVVGGLLQWWVSTPERALETFVDLIVLALLALAVSATTPVNAMIDALVRALSPLRRLGLDPEVVALTFALAIAALPGLVVLAVETRDAARARGLGRNPRAYLTPFVIRVVARAQESGDALVARGLAD